MDFEQIQGAIVGGLGGFAMGWVHIRHLQGEIVVLRNSQNATREKEIAEISEKDRLLAQSIEALTLNTHLLNKVNEKFDSLQTRGGIN